jgi:hypothetical protein
VTGRRWRQEHVDSLIVYWRAGMPIQEIADVLGYTYMGVAGKAYQLELGPHPKPRPTRTPATIDAETAKKLRRLAKRKLTRQQMGSAIGRSASWINKWSTRLHLQMPDLRCRT